MTPTRSLFLFCALLNIVLASLAGYLWLGIRAQDLYLVSRWEAALSVFAPASLPPASVSLYSASTDAAPSYEPVCTSYRTRPDYLGHTKVLEPYDILDASIVWSQGPQRLPIVSIHLRENGLQKLRSYSRTHVGHAVAFVANGAVLHVSEIEAPVESSPLLIGGAGLSEREARLLVFWLCRRK